MYNRTVDDKVWLVSFSFVFRSWFLVSSSSSSSIILWSGGCSCSVCAEVCGAAWDPICGCCCAPASPGKSGKPCCTAQSKPRTTSFRKPARKEPITKFHRFVLTPKALQFHTLGPLPISPSPCNNLAGNSSFNLAGSDLRIMGSVEANFRPPGMAALHVLERQTYSQPTMKKGFSMS